VPGAGLSMPIHIKKQPNSFIRYYPQPSEVKQNHD
jgi:hypothetical protein